MSPPAQLSVPPQAQPAEREWLVRYEVDAHCPSEGAFREALRSRLRRAPELALRSVRLSVQISASPHAHVWVGRIEVSDGSVVTTREVEDASCAAVVHAMTLVAALSADGSTASEEPPPRAVRTPARSEPERPMSVPEDQPASREFEPRAGGKPQLGGAFLAVAQSALGPQVATGVGVGVVFDWPARGIWRPWLQLAGASLEASEAPLGRAKVATRFDALLLMAAACPLSILARDGGWLGPCLDLDVGRLTGAGRGRAVAQPAVRHALWLSTGLSLRGVIELWGPLALSTSLGVSAPLTRHEFFFAPDTEAFRVPALGWRATGSLALMF